MVLESPLIKIVQIKHNYLDILKFYFVSLTPS